MRTEQDNKYWEDYTAFIKEVEDLTGLSPSDLLSRYKDLISELNDNDKEYFIEWQYELNNELWTRQKIQSVIDHKPIFRNVLLTVFKEKVESLDVELKKYILNSEQLDWWREPKLKI